MFQMRQLCRQPASYVDGRLCRRILSLVWDMEYSMLCRRWVLNVQASACQRIIFETRAVFRRDTPSTTGDQEYAWYG